MMWSYGYGWGSFFWMVLWLALWAILFGGLIWLMVRSLQRSILHASHREVRILSSEPSAIEILQRRYARGELDDYTFDRMCARLEETNPSGQANHRAPMVAGK